MKREYTRTEYYCDERSKESGVVYSELFLKERNDAGYCTNRGFSCAGGCGKEVCIEHGAHFRLEKFFDNMIDGDVVLCRECMFNNEMTIEQMVVHAMTRRYQSNEIEQMVEKERYGWRVLQKDDEPTEDGPVTTFFKDVSRKDLNKAQKMAMNAQYGGIIKGHSVDSKIVKDMLHANEAMLNELKSMKGKKKGTESWSDDHGNHTIF